MRAVGVTPGRQLPRDKGVDGGVLARIYFHLVNPVLAGEVYNHVGAEVLQQVLSPSTVGEVDALEEPVYLFAEKEGLNTRGHGEDHVLADYAGGAKDGDFH